MASREVSILQPKDNCLTKLLVENKEWGKDSSFLRGRCNLSIKSKLGFKKQVEIIIKMMGPQ